MIDSRWSGAMQSIEDLKVMPKGIHHQLIQQALQLLHKGFMARCISGIQRQKKRIAKDCGKGDKGD